VNDNCYYVNGHRKREQIGPSKKLAKAVLHKRKIEIAENKYLDKRKVPKTTLPNLLNLFLEYSKLNKKSYEGDKSSAKNILSFFGNRNISEITPLDIEKYKQFRKEKVKPATVKRDLEFLRSVFNKGIEWGKALHNPVSKFKRLKEPAYRLSYLLLDEIDRLISAAAYHIKPIIITALHTGMRRGEILKLKWADIGFNNRLIEVVETKNNEKRYVPIDSTLLAALRNIPRRIDSDYVFCNREGKPYTDIKNSFRSALKRASIDNFRFHDLRHTFASHLIMSGADLTTAKELLGHKSIKMTMRYSHLSQDYKRQAIDKMDTKEKQRISNSSKLLKNLAPQVGLEPTTLRLTAGCSAN